MTDREKQERDLIDARKECDRLWERDGLAFASLIRQFRRLDAAEQAEIAAGREGGKLGGRPASENPTPDALRKRRERAAKKDKTAKKARKK